MPVPDMAQLAKATADMDLEFVVLFGSQASGTSHARSDVDLAVMPSDSTPGNALDILRELSHRLQRSDLDLVWLPEASWLLEWQVTQRGRLLAERHPGRFSEFQHYATMRRADSPYWRYLKRRYIDRLLEGILALDAALVEGKAAEMAQYLKELEPVFGCDPQRFTSDALLRHAGERLLELLVECAGAPVPKSRSKRAFPHALRLCSALAAIRSGHSRSFDRQA